MRHVISDQYQQYEYFLDIEDIRELKYVKLSVKYQGAKFPDVIQSQVEFFLNPDEWKRLVDTLTSIK
jgi:hypothetical protein